MEQMEMFECSIWFYLALMTAPCRCFWPYILHIYKPTLYIRINMIVCTKKMLLLHIANLMEYVRYVIFTIKKRKKKCLILL